MEEKNTLERGNSNSKHVVLIAITTPTQMGRTGLEAIWVSKCPRGLLGLVTCGDRWVPPRTCGATSRFPLQAINYMIIIIVRLMKSSNLKLKD